MIELAREGFYDAYLDQLQIAFNGKKTDANGKVIQKYSRDERVQASELIGDQFNKSFETEQAILNLKYQTMLSNDRASEAHIVKQAVQAMAVSSDLPQALHNLTSQFELTTPVDAGWMAAFADMSRFIQNDQVEIEIDDFTKGTVWKMLGEAEPVESSTVSGELAYWRIGKMGALLEWTEEMVRFRKFGRIFQRADLFVRRFNEKQADIHYDLLTRGSGSNVTTYIAVGTDTTASDIATLDSAVYTVLERLKNKGVSLDAPLIAYYQTNEAARKRIRNMRVQLHQNVAGSGLESMSIGQVDFRATWNTNLPALAGDAFKLLLVKPGDLIQRGELGPVEFLGPETDILTYTHAKSAWKWEGAAVMDEDQIQTVRFT